MKNSLNKTARIHGMDSLRANMMLLGLALHTAITYGTYNYSPVWSMKDPNATHWIFDWMVTYIHIFRMPVFFLVAGFFGALLFYERTPKKMFMNRIYRVFFPLLISIFLLWPLVVGGFGFSNVVFAGTENPMDFLATYYGNIMSYIPQRTMHLWFLYYLLLFSITFYFLGLLLKRYPTVTSILHAYFEKLIQMPHLKVLLPSLVTVVVLIIMGKAWVATSTSFIVDLNTFVFYLMFYAFGWVFFKSKHLLDTFKKNDIAYTIIGTVLITIRFFRNEPLPYEHIIFNSLSVWFLIFGITGLFLRYLNSNSERTRYISDASYWVYLLHLPVLSFLPGLLAPFDLSPFIKFTLAIIIANVICFVSYHYLVRDSIIGKFLNGRRYKRNSLLPKVSFSFQKST